jgi:hypothetical protein
MALDHHKSVQTVWAALLIAMGVLLCVKTPHALQNTSGPSFLSFARYFIAILLIVGGAKKLYGLYICRPEEPTVESSVEDLPEAEQ